MELFLQGNVPLRHWYSNPNEKSNKYKSSLLSYLTYESLNGAQFLQENVTTMPAFMSWHKFAIKEVNDWALSPENIWQIFKRKKWRVNFFVISRHSGTMYCQCQICNIINKYKVNKMAQYWLSHVHLASK